MFHLDAHASTEELDGWGEPGASASPYVSIMSVHVMAPALKSTLRTYFERTHSERGFRARLHGDRFAMVLV